MPAPQKPPRPRPKATTKVVRSIRSRSRVATLEEQEEEERRISRRLNALRAAVLGANDGIVSIAALVVGVAAAKPDESVIATAGFAGLAAGALSMAVGEYISVHSQRDAEEAQLERERRWHRDRPEWELEQLARLHVESGMSVATARKAAREQTAHDPLAAHARAHLGIDPKALVSPIQAGIASLIAFTIGGALPILTILLASDAARIPLTFTVVPFALATTGYFSARTARARYRRAIARNVIGGSLAMAITYGIGHLVGTVV